MANRVINVRQENPDKMKFTIYLPPETVAKLRMVAKSKPAAIVRVGNRVSVRPVSVGMLISDYLDEKLADVKLDADELKWAIEKRKELLASREEADKKVRAGANRKDPKDFKKPGRVAGKVYPAYDKYYERLRKKRDNGGSSESGQK